MAALRGDQNLNYPVRANQLVRARQNLSPPFTSPALAITRGYHLIPDFTKGEACKAHV